MPDSIVNAYEESDVFEICIDLIKSESFALPAIEFCEGGGYRDACFPSEREFRQQFRQAVLDAYEQALYQLPQRQQEYQAESTQNSESM